MPVFIFHTIVTCFPERLLQLASLLYVKSHHKKGNRIELQMVVCCHLLQHAPTGTVVRVKSCINSRYPGQLMGWSASSTITLFKFNKIKNSYGPPPILHHREGIRNLGVLRGEERTQPSSPAWSRLGQGTHRCALLRAEEGAVWEPQQHMHQQQPDSGVPRPLPEQDLQNSVTPVHVYLKPKVF